MKFYYTYCDQSYAPVAGGALPDSEYLAALGDRLMFRHGSPTQPKLALFVAPRGILHAGWVIGVFDEPFITETETIKAEPGARYPFTARSEIAEDNQRALQHFDPVVDDYVLVTNPGNSGGNHGQPQRHKWENDHTDDALTYGDIRTEK